MVAPNPKKHYTQQPSRLKSELQSKGERTVLYIEGCGFVTADMVDNTLAAWPPPKPPQQPEQPAQQPTEILVDLREVLGYEAGCVGRVQKWLTDAHRLGVRRIAFVASSSVLRTATHVASKAGPVDLRTFDDKPNAQRWLERKRNPAC